MSSQIGKAIFNLQRFQILQTKLNPATSGLISNSYAHAWQHCMYPIMDEGEIHSDLKDYFKITKEQVKEIMDYADSEWRNGNLYTFYEYEDHYDVRIDGKLGIDRHILMVVFRYLFLSRTFDDAFWDRLLTAMEHPAESSSILRDFTYEDLYIVI